jgi:hypothetical protein
MDRASRIAREASTYLPAVAMFQSSYPPKCILGALRKIVITEIDVLFLKISREAEQLKPRENLWIRSYPTKDDYGIEVISWNPSPTEVSIPLNQLEELMIELRTAVLDGKMDDQLHLKTETLVHDKMSKASEILKASQDKGFRIGVDKPVSLMGTVSPKE